MSHVKRTLSGKQKGLSTLSSHMKVKERSCGADVCVPSFSSVCRRTEEQGCSSQKIKRLKTIKERNLIRGQSNYRSNHICQHSKRACKKNCYRGHECRCSHSLICSKREKPVDKPFHLEKTSIITEGRLTSIRGLFSHEVRSVDIERLVRVKERQKEHITAEKSPCQSDPSVLSEKADGDICTFVEETQMFKTSEQTDHAQTNLEGLDKTNGKHINKTTQSESPPCQNISEIIVLTSSGSETNHKTSSITFQAAKTNQNVHASPLIRNSPRLHDLVQTRQTTSIGESHSNTKDVLQSNSTPAISERRATVVDESLSRNPEPYMEAVGRVAARLCHSLLSFPKLRHRPFLTECKEILFQCLQDRHGSQLEHNLRKLRSFNSAEEHRSPLITKQAWPSSAQSFVDTCTFLNRKTGYDVDHSANLEFQAGKGSQDLVGEDFDRNTERKAQCRMRRTHYWGTYTPQDFLQKLQPSPDTLRKQNMCSGTVQSLDFPQAKTCLISPSTSHHSLFTWPQIPKPPSWPPNWPYMTSDSFFLQPQNQRNNGETKPRQITLLLEQYRHDPDLSFPWSCTKKIHPESPLREVSESPLQQFKSATDRPLASSSSSAFFSSEGFRYQPFYRFPHPRNSTNSSERPGRSQYTQSDVQLKGLSSTDLYSSNLPYWP